MRQIRDNAMPDDARDATTRTPVSVVMPVRDAGACLREAVGSILAQDYPEFELIIVDDGSSDGAVEALPRDFRRDPRVRVLVTRRAGVVAAMQSGVRVADGEYIARMDSDDIALRDRLSRQAEFLAARPDIGIAGGEVTLFREGGVGGGFRRYEAWLNALREPEDIDRALYIESPIPNPTALFRRDAYEALSGYRDTDWPEDYDLFLRAHAAGIRMGKPAGVLLRWRDHERRLTRSDPRYDHRRFMAASGYYLSRGPLHGRAAVIWGAGRCGSRYHDILVANGARVDGFIDIHPRRIGGRK
ncbi:MAG: glycosyltransferase, partial [Proteobacteria bacterium]